ncbi:MAG: energy-coupling factor ABC transporter permease [Burkholderiales bacterium]|nr:energy-coupling factor ABC transporter permease [Burkholderiales bacterium]
MAWLACATLGGWIVRTAPWRRLRDNASSHLWLGTCVALTLIWCLQPPTPGIRFHLLGATVVTLMFGPQLAMVAVAVAALLLTLTGRLSGELLPLTLLLLAAMPVLLSQLTLHLAERRLPRHFFVFIFVSAFLGSALAMGASSIASAALVAWRGEPDVAMLAEQLLPYCLLLAFAEATLTGMVITVMVVYRPRWVGSFDDTRYLPGR